jgi:hypothetical protein
MQSIAEDPLVAKERVLGAALLMIAGLLLPLTSSDLANTPDNPISCTTSAASGLRGLDRWHNDPRAPADCSVVQHTAAVGAVAVDTEVHILPTTNALAAVFDSSPLTVAEAAETTAVDNQVDPAKLQWQTQRHLQPLATGEPTTSRALVVEDRVEEQLVELFGVLHLWNVSAAFE